MMSEVEMKISAFNVNFKDFDRELEKEKVTPTPAAL